MASEYLQKLADELNESCDYKDCKDKKGRLLAYTWKTDDLSFDKNEYRSYCHSDPYYDYYNIMYDSCNSTLIEKIDNVFDKNINDIIIENILIKERIARLEALLRLR